MSEQVSEYEPFEVTPLRNSNVQYVYSRKSLIDMDPVYQRQSDAWSIEKKQLLIDSLLNGFDIPTIYFHQVRNGGRLGWALVDGKQRLEAIFDFLENKYALADDFVLLRDPSIKAAKFTRQDLDRHYPLLASDLLASDLDIKEIRTQDSDVIEDLFSRLNEAVPLNAAEKRNAFPGPLPGAVRTLAEHDFFKKKVPFNNRRYRHRDLAAKFLLLTAGGSNEGSPYWAARDLKKIRLDRFFIEVSQRPDAEAEAAQWERTVTRTLDAMLTTFVDNDRLLNVGMATVYFLLYINRIHSGKSLPSRVELEEFDRQRRVGQVDSESDFTKADIIFLEVNRLSQSPNDGSALAYRLKVLETWLDALESGQDPLESVGTLYGEEFD